MGDGSLFDPREGVRVEAVFQQISLEVFQHLNGFIDVITIEVGIQAHETDAAKHLTLGPWPVGQAVVETNLPVQRPVEIILENVEGLIVLIIDHRFRHQPVQLGAVADKTTGEGAFMGGAGADVRQWPMLARLDRVERAPRALQIRR